MILVVDNHGDRCCPLCRATWDPFQMAMKMAEKNGGDPNYLLNGMILQVGNVSHLVFWSDLETSPGVTWICWNESGTPLRLGVIYIQFFGVGWLSLVYPPKIGRSLLPLVFLDTYLEKINRPHLKETYQNSNAYCCKTKTHVFRHVYWQARILKIFTAIL